MTVNDCTREELIYIINCISRLSDYHVKRILNEIEYNREMKKIDEAQKWAETAYQKRREAIEILKLYEGQSPADIPLFVLQKVQKLFEEAEKADKKWAELSK